MSSALATTSGSLGAIHSCRILVIDDEAVNVEVIGLILREAGFTQISGVTDPREALQRYAEFDPDLIILDLRMPHLDGFMLLQKFRAQVPGDAFLPILVLTSDWTSEARHRALSCGATDFLTRPLDNAEIVLRVTNLLSTRVLHSQLARQKHGLEAAVAERTAELQAANERLQQEIATRQHAEAALRRQSDFVHMLEVVTTAASQSAPVHQVLQVALDQVCASTGWEVGHGLKRASSGLLVSTGLWHVQDPARTAGFRQKSEESSYASGAGLPGRVLASGQPAWIVDLQHDLNFQRGELAATLGLQSGFALPVLVAGEVVAVLEFFSTRNHAPDREMLESMHHVGAQLGRVLERQRSEEALRSSEAKFRSFAQLGSDGIVLADSLGRIISWNHGAQQIFGYAEDEALGRSLAMLIPKRLRPEVAAGPDLVSQAGFLRLVGRRVEFIGLRRDGSEFPMELSLDIWTTWDGTFCSGVIRDVSERRKMEETLRESEERQRRLLEATKVIPWTMDFKQQRVRYIGPQIVALLGFPLEAWSQPGFWAARLHPEDRDWVIRHCQEALERRRSFEIEHRLQTADGRTVWVQTLASPSPSPGCSTLNGFVLDISSQKHAQEALREYAAVIEYSHEAIIGSTLDGTITSWNRGAERLCGYAQGEILGVSATRLVPESHAERLEAELAAVARGEYLESRDSVLKRKDGTLVEVTVTVSPIRDAHNRVSSLCCIARDNSERKRAEEALRRSHDRLEAEVAQRTHELQEANALLRSEISDRREVEQALRASENRLKTLVASIEETIFEFDEQGRYTRSWAGDEELIGQVRRQFAAPFQQLLNQSIGSTLPEIVQRVVATGRPETIEHTIDCAGGKRWFLSRIAPMHDAFAGRKSACLLARDITHRKRAEEELRAAMNDAERANSAKTNFLSRMSHELRTPLNAILGFAQLLDRDRMSPEDVEGVDQILGSGNHLLGLINEVLDMARIEVGRLTLSLEAVNCTETLGEAVSLVRPDLGSRRLKVDDFPAPAVIADRARLRQVLQNLLSNAIKYCGEEGEVTVTRERGDGVLRISVCDTGPGIPEAKMGHLFMPFARLDSNPAIVEGIGLGLAISKRLVELMGGRIGVESRPGEGCTFWITLPLATEAESVEAGEIPVDEDLGLLALGPCTVLYIEDNLSNLKLVERLIGRQPEVQLLAATHGHPGLELAIRHQPAIILLDLHLPDIPGAEVLARLRAEPRTAQIPVILTSADPYAAASKRFDPAHIQGFISKPLDLEKFTEALTRALRPR